MADPTREGAPKHRLERAIGLPRATALVIGTIIGASIFAQPSEITGQVPSISGVFIVWLAAGVLTLFGAMVCAELAGIYPRTGGVYVFLREIYAPSLGFLWGWAMFWVMHSGIIAAIAVIFARYMGFFLPLGEGGTKLVAILAILLLSAVNAAGVRHGSALQTAFTAGKLLAILLVIALGLTLGQRVPEHFVGAASPPDPSLSAFTAALVAGLFAYGGWHMVTYSAGETIEPRRTIPRALLLGVGVVTLAYIAMNAVYLFILPLDVVTASERIAADAADAVLGYGGGAVMSALVVFSTFGGLSGIVLAGPRVYHAMSEDGLLFRWVGELDPATRTPVVATALQAIWASVLAGTGSYRALFNWVVYTEWLFFGLLAVGLILLRSRPGAERPWSLWGYPFVPIIFALSSFFIVAHRFFANPRDALLGMTIVLLGLPVYAVWKWAQPARKTDE